MSAPETLENLSSELRDTARMIRQTFPTGVPVRSAFRSCHWNVRQSEAKVRIYHHLKPLHR